MKKKIYLYPKVFPRENPYIRNLENSISSRFEIVNKGSNPYGIADLIMHFFRTDIYYLNWIEDLVSRRFGKLQVVVAVIFIKLAKLFGKKIVWTLHNKYSHYKRKSKWVDIMFNLMFKHSDIIITHSGEGINFAREYYPQYSAKVRYFIHPVIPVIVPEPDEKPEYDFFIWGTIWPYKGIIEFLRFMRTSGNSHLKILIAGICINDQMKTDLMNVLYENVKYLDHFHDMEEIATISKKARFTVFTYRSESILSSGSLMDSIGNGSIIIGPDTGAFKDLSSFGFIRTYRTFPDIIEIQNNYKPNLKEILVERTSFLKDNSWEMFGYRLCNEFVDKLGL